MRKAVVCLAAGNITYVEGARGQIGALRECLPGVDHVLMIEEDSYNSTVTSELIRNGWIVKEVPPIRTLPGPFNAPRWVYTFTTFNVWNLTEYDRIVFLDLDAMPVTPCLEIFDFPPFSATRVKESFHKRFSSGIMVLEPDADTFLKLFKHATTLPHAQIGAKCGDQGVLNSFLKGEFNYIHPTWNWKYWNRPTPKDIKIAHIRPVPWSGRKGPINMQPYTDMWKMFRGQYVL